MTKLSHLFKMSRPIHALLACGGIWLCLLILGCETLDTYIKAGLVAFLLPSWAFIHNDIHDIESDRVFRKDRPLISGKVSVEEARATSIVLMMMTIASSALLGVEIFLFTLFTILASYWYNIAGKKRGHIFGLFVTAFSGAGIILAPTIITRNLALLPLAAALFLMETGRDIMLQIQDVEFDSKAGYRTFPMVVGMERATKIALAFYIVSIPFFYLVKLGIVYDAGITLLIGVLLYGWYRMRSDRRFDVYQRWGRLVPKALLIAIVLLMFAEKVLL